MNRDELTKQAEYFEEEEHDILAAFSALQRRSHALARAKEFWLDMGQRVPESAVEARLPATLLLSVSEVCEAFEEARGNGLPLNAVYVVNHNLGGEAVREPFELHGCHEWWRGREKPEGLAIELADAVIRIADLAEALGVDLGEAIIAKHRYNQTRPARHGGKRW